MFKSACVLCCCLCVFNQCAPLESSQTVSQGVDDAIESQENRSFGNDVELALENELSRVRGVHGQGAVRRSEVLDQLALQESQRLVEEGSRKANVSWLRDRSQYGKVGVLVGQLQDRGASTGEKFLSYWMKKNHERDIVLGEWSHMGIGSSKTQDGSIVTVVVFGSSSGVSLMDPIMGF